MTVCRRDTILVAPIGTFDVDVLHVVETMIMRTFALKCRIQPLIKDIGFAWHAERRQFHSTLILAKLARACPPDALKILALTREDLFIPILTHVYGEAQLGGASCIVSTCRLSGHFSATAQRDLYLDRIAKECAHELGHTFDLRHCKDHQCLMHYCRSLRDVDGKSDQFCRYCQVLLNDYLMGLNS